MNRPFWPKFTQELLLKAAFLEETKASEAWGRWQKLADLSTIDPISLRLLPKIYANLYQSNLRQEARESLYFKANPPQPDSAESQIEQVHEIYYSALEKNNHLLSQAEPVIKELHQAHISILLFKETALALKHYQNFGLRPLQSIDLLIPQTKAVEAIEHFIQKGWKPQHPTFQKVKKFNSVFAAVYPSLALINKTGGECHLYWKVEGFENDLYQFAQPFLLHGIPLQIPAPTELFLQVCLQGTECHPPPHFRWEADALVLLREKSAIDWRHLASTVRRCELALPLKKALSYLKETFQAPVPLEFLQTLDELPTSTQAAALSEDKENFTPWQLWMDDLFFLWRKHSQLSRRIKLFTFPRFLQKLWGLESIAELPLHFIRWQIRRWRAQSRRNPSEPHRFWGPFEPPIELKNRENPTLHLVKKERRAASREDRTGYA